MDGSDRKCTHSENVWFLTREKITNIRNCTILFLCILLSGSCRNGGTEPKPNTQKLKTKQTERESPEQIVEGIYKIRILPVKEGEPFEDPYAQKIISLGRKAAPFLANKIVETTPSNWGYTVSYEIGDMAHLLLCEIYGKSFFWPIEGQRQWQERDRSMPPIFVYKELIELPGAREDLKEMWLELIRSEESAIQ